MPNAPRLLFCCLALLAAAAFSDLTGCKPAAPTATVQQTSASDSSTPHQPTAGDFQAFFQSLQPPVMKVSGVKADPPVRLPNTSPASNVWLMSVKITLTPTEDLLSLPSPQDTMVIDDLVAELNSLVGWRNSYVHSPYAKACGDFTVKVPASPLPQLLVLTQPKNQPLPPIYVKVTAEWQVDHWQFESVSDNANVKMPDVGKLRSDFTGPTVVKGSPEAEKALLDMRNAIAQARKEIDAIRGRYAERIAKGTKPGTTYQGRVTFRQNVQPCEVHFVEPSPGADAHFASLEVTLPNEKPPCVFTYNAKIKTELPIPVPGTASTQENTNPLLDLDASGQPLLFNMRVSLVRSVGKTDERSLPGQILSGNRHDTGSQTLLLLDGHLEGIISYYNAPGIVISVQHVNPTR